MPPVLCPNFNIKNLTIPEIDRTSKNNKSEGQWISFPKYSHGSQGEENFIFQTPAIQFTQYGMPSKNSKFVKNDKDRMFIKMPFDPSQPGCTQVRTMLEAIDNDVGSSAQQKRILGAKFAPKYKYQAVVREPMEMPELLDDPDEDTKAAEPAKERYDYCKMKLSNEFVEDGVGDITTIVYVKDPVTGKSEKADVRTVSDLDEYFSWGCTARMIVMVNKLWASKSPSTDKFYRYGISMKILQMEVTPRERSGSIKESFSRFAFIDPEDTDATQEPEPEAAEDENEEVVEEEAEAAAGSDEEAEEAEEDEEAEDEESEEEEEVAAPPPKPTKKGQVAAKAQAPAKVASKGKPVRK